MSASSHQSQSSDHVLWVAAAELGSDPNSGQSHQIGQKRPTDLAKPQVQGSDPSSAGRTKVASFGSYLRCASYENRVQRLWPAGEGMAGGLILDYQKSAPGHSLSGDKWHLMFARLLNSRQERTKDH